MRLAEEYKQSGYFWIAGQEDKKVPGTLSIYDGGKIKLDIVDTFGSRFTDDALSMIPRIVGNVESGYVTLEDCFPISENISFGGIGKSKIIVNQVYSGVCYDKDDEITFNTISFSVDCLDEWIKVSGFSNEYYPTLKTNKISYTQPEDIVFELNNGMQLEICFSASFPLGNRATEVKIKQQAYFKLKSKTLKPLDDFRNIVYKLTNFLCFAMDDIVTVKDMSATSTELQRDMGEGKSSPVQVKIYYSSHPYSEKIPKKSEHHMLFTYGIIKENLHDVLNNWFNAYEIISPAMGLYFSTQTNGHKYLEGKFLALAQGLETYHRRTSDAKVMDENEFSSLVKEIVNACPEEQQEWLKGRLKYGNEISLAKRLEQIIEPFKEKFANNKECKRLIRKIVDTRNYFTHYDEGLESKAATNGNKLYELCKKMEVMFQLHFLKVIGFTDKEIDNVIKNNYSVKQKIAKKEI